MWTRCLNTDLRHLNPVSLEKLFSKRETLAYHTSSFPAGGRHINISLQQRTQRNLRFRITDERPFSTCAATLVRGYCDPRSRSSGITVGFEAIGVLFAEFMFYACPVCMVIINHQSRFTRLTVFYESMCFASQLIISFIDYWFCFIQIFLNI